METYFLLNVIVSFVVLGLFKYGKGTSIANYRLSIFAIIIWFIPYSFITELIPQEALVEPLVLKQSITNQFVVSELTRHNPSANDQMLMMIRILLLLVGIALFVRQLGKTLTLSKRILNHPSLTFHPKLSRQHHIPIYSAENVPNGMLLGVKTPKIIFSNSITKSKQIELIICHEKKHLERRDNHKLVLLELIDSLFWWNPLVKQLTSKTRFYIEALCDETASQDFVPDEYIQDISLTNAIEVQQA